MLTAITIPELTYKITSYLLSQTDLSSLSRCNRRLYDITIHLLYQDIKISAFEARYLARSLEGNASLSRFVQKLSITLNYGSTKRSGATHNRRIDEGLLYDLELVINQCSAHGNLKHFLCDYDPPFSVDYPSIYEWRTSAMQEWKLLSFPKAAFQSLQSIIIRDRRMSLCSIHSLDTELLSQCSFPFVTRLELDFRISDAEFQGSRRLLSAFPNVKLLVLTTRNKTHAARIPGTDGMVTLLPDIKFEHLLSLTLRLGSYALTVYPVNFIDEQPSLTEVHICSRPMHHSIGMSPKVKGLSFGLACFVGPPPPGHILGSLSVLRLCVTKGKISNAWTTYLNGAQQIKCIEIVQPFGNYHARVEHTIRSLRLMNFVEIGVISEGPLQALSTTNVYSSFIGSLDSLLASCCMVDSVRAFRLSCTCADYAEKTFHPNLPDEYTLDSSRVPFALEHVLVEDPREKKLYKVERSYGGTIRMVYTGLERLPGRTSNPNLTWSNDSILDHMRNTESEGSPR